MPKLVMLNGERAGHEYALDDGTELTLGRADECDIVLRNIPGVSREHARFLQEDGRWVVRDLKSQNGIYCGKQKVDHRVLEDRDVLWFSNASLRYETDEADPKKNIYFKTATDKDGDKGAGETAAGESGQGRKDRGDAPKADAADGGGRKTADDDDDDQAMSPADAPTTPPPASRETGGDAPDADRIKRVREYADRVEEQFAKVIVGQRQVLELLLTALLADGHCLMIGLPGLAKTLMVSSLSQILDLRFKRIQFTPDLMPSDIIGSDVLELDEESGQKSFRFIEGPVFSNMILADEINRTPPKTQAALLEAMQERQVSASNQLFQLPAPFFVLATQNPLEQEGTYPLPEAQLDRFMFNILVDYPGEEDEEDIVMQTTGRQSAELRRVLTGEQLLELQQIVRDLPVSRHVVRYATRLTRASRPEDKRAPDDIKEHVACGAGPRAAQFLVLGAKARAVLRGSLNVSCDDVRALAPPILRHRLFTNFAADSEGVTPDDLVKRLLLTVKEPSGDT